MVRLRPKQKPKHDRTLRFEPKIRGTITVYPPPTCSAVSPAQKCAKNVFPRIALVILSPSTPYLRSVSHENIKEEGGRG